MFEAIGAWNIMGAHNDIKLSQCKMIIAEYKLKVMAILETKLDQQATARAARIINPSWSFLHN